MQQQSWYQKNNERAREYNKQRRLKNREKLNAYRRAWSKARLAEDTKYREQKNKETAEWKARNKERVAAYQREYRQKNKERLRAQDAVWKRNNPDKLRRIRQAHFVRNRFALYAKSKHVRRATPAWANKFFIAEIYHLARLRTEHLGVKHQVDHIVPLRSKLVCGLHCEANLRVIPAAENNKKNNRTWPDMPDDR